MFYSWCCVFSYRTISYNILKDRAYEIAKNSENNGYQKALASMVYTFFDKTKDWE